MSREAPNRSELPEEPDTGFSSEKGQRTLPFFVARHDTDIEAGADETWELECERLDARIRATSDMSIRRCCS
ncbi:MAG: hypothetical protein U1E83_08165 [Methylotetracoccus sp.]